MHLEAITLEQKRILSELKNFPEFYLAGGTGLALQLGHRVSADFDFFWEKEIPRSLLSKIKRIFRDAKTEVVVNTSEQLTVTIQGIHLSFVKYPFPVILKLIDFQRVKILPVLEIAAMKTYALGRRATLKDYVDLYFIVKKKKATLKKIISLAEKKYEKEFELRLFLEQLIYSKDVEDMEIQFLKEKVTKLEIEKFFEKEIKKIRFS